MSKKGDKIAPQNMSQKWASEFSDQHSSQTQRYAFVCCACWYLICEASYAALGGSGRFDLTIDHWDGSQWVPDLAREVSGVNGSVSYYYGHNRDEGNLTEAFHSPYPLYRIGYKPTRSNSRWSITVYAGGWGIATDTLGNYINYPKGAIIRSKGRTGDPIHASTEADDGLTVFNPANRKGAPILATDDDSELVAYPY